MLFHFIAHTLDAAFSHDVPIVQQHHAIGHHVHFVQDVTGDNQIQPLGRKVLEQRDRLSANHGIETIQWFVQNQHRWMMSYRLGQPDALAHAFAVRSNLAVRRIHEINSAQSFVS